jgi:inhibitor of KinA sporulation pathway (predicted exonuclease)
MTTPCWGPPRQLPYRYLHILDTETTGFPGEDDEAHVVEVGIVTLELTRGSATPVAEHSWFVRAPVLKPRHLAVCAKISRITRADIEGGLTPEASAQILLRHAWTHPGPITAWNMPFDRRMIRRTLFGLREESVHDFGADLKYGAPVDFHMSDGLIWGGCAARHYIDAKGPVAGHFDMGGGEPGPRLTTLSHACSLEGVDMGAGDAHRALWDTKVTSQIVAKLWKGEVVRWDP